MEVQCFGAVLVGNSFGMRSYEKCASKSFGMRGYRIVELKVSWNQQLQKMWGVGLPMWRVPGVCHSGRRGESKSEARGGSLLGAEIARRGYDVVPVEDLHSDRVAGIIPVCLG